jgi:plasmid stability protein
MIERMETIERVFRNGTGCDVVRHEASQLLALLTLLALLALLARREDGGIGMATLTIRGMDDELRDRLKLRAARHSRSMEAEVRAIIAGALASPVSDDALGSRIHQRFASIGGIEMEPVARTDQPRSWLG